MASRGVNKVILLGNVGRDPDIRELSQGGIVANLAVATSEVWKDKNTGEQQERTEWHNIVFYGRLAEIVEQYVRKGGKVYIEGSLQTRSWEQDGVKRYATEVRAGELQLLSPPSSSGSSEPAPEPRRAGRSESRAPRREAPADNYDDDIPF